LVQKAEVAAPGEIQRLQSQSSTQQVQAHVMFNTPSAVEEPNITMIVLHRNGSSAAMLTTVFSDSKT
jgi:hypothetical protein